MTTARILMAMLCALGTLGAAQAEVPTERAAENRLFRVMDDILHARSRASAALPSLLEGVPASHLAHMAAGDLMMMRAHGEVLWAHPGVLERMRIAGLREEAVRRLFFQPPLPEYLPMEVLSLSALHRYVVLLDASRSRLFLLENVDGEPHVRAGYYASVGLAGMGKRQSGDRKTPLGVYRLTGWYGDAELAELYGVGAYPLSYPNGWDKLNERSGSGIWIHGTPRTMGSRPPQDSRGCIVINNDILAGIRRQTHQPTLAVLTRRSHWVPAEDWRMARDAMRGRMAQWRNDWESLDVDKYLAHYSPDYKEKGADYTTMIKRVRRNAKRKTSISVEMDRVDLFLYPGEEKQVLAVFDQDYRSNNYDLNYRKQQMWREEGGELRIVSEGKWE